MTEAETRPRLARPMSKPLRLPAFPLSPRFEAIEQLGRGANGVVFRARDTETGREVALKTLSSPDADQLYHLKAEFRSLASIEHPNLVHLEELVVSGSDCFFTMELLDGPTFAGFVEELAGPPEARSWTGPALARLRAVVGQLVAAVAALHEAGKLHRDIKPSNVLVTEGDRAVLVDFGLCTELRLVERAKSPLVGTLLYMAPEQAWGKPLTAAADWYALGAVLYEALAGRLPFDGTGSRVLFDKAREAPVPHGLPDAAQALAELAAALLHPEPARRPAPEAIAALVGGDEPLPASREIAARAPPFVGRRDALRVLGAALSDVESGRPAVVDVEGPSGIGKTELVERFLTTLEAAPGAVVLRGRCHPQESVSYNGFDGVVDALSEWLTQRPTSELAELLPPDAASLRALFPVFGRVPAIATLHHDPADAAYDRRLRAFRALRDLLAAVGARYTLAIAIDDLQWGGSDTASLLAEVFRPPGTPRSLLVLAYRADDAERAPLLSVLRERAADLLDSVHRVSLGPIERADSVSLSLALLSPDAEDGRRVAERIADAAGGHPLYLRELALAAAAAPSAAPDASRDLTALLRARVASLPDAERALLELAAAAGRPLTRRILLAACGQGEPARPLVLRLSRMRLLRETSLSGHPAIEPYHAHVREAVRASLEEDRVRAHHRAIADALLAEPEPDPDALVDHLVGAYDRQGAARYAVVAAERASASLAFERAVHLYRLALELGVNDAERVRVRTRLASALTDAGRGREAAEAYAAAADEARARGADEARELDRLAAEHYLRVGRRDEGVRLLRRVLDAVAVPYPSSAVGTFGTVAFHRTLLAARGLGWSRAPEEAVDPAELARIDACWSAGLGLALFDRARTAAFQARFMLLALRAGEPTRVARALATEASQLAAIGGRARTARARAILQTALDATESSGDPAARTFNLLMAGSIEFYASRWRAALEHLERAERALERGHSRSEWELLTGNMLALAALAYVGELRELRARQAALLEAARQRDNRLAAVCLACGPASVGWLAAGEPEEAKRRIDAALAPWDGGDFELPQYLHLVADVQIALYRGDARRAFERVVAAWPRAVASMSLYVQNFRVTLRHLRGRAAVALAATLGGGPVARLERAALLRLARADARRLADDDVAWSPALADALEAAVLAQSGEESAAATVLARAADRFRELDMLLHAAAADHERGRLVGGAGGRALLRAAEEWMVAEHVASPEELAAALVPGLSRRGRP